ncbi:Arc family DNA-binding protein [Thauera humireducens]|uniref:Arc family DNA-binding protein n=1 Tax=Thauera humireducens TaxID=1134435 RepID=UPI0009EE26FD|nr:Arc family DNA-binding protein [Thauera humireducens]
MEEKQNMASMMLRLPAPLKEWVKSRAEKADRSMNWMVVKLLEQARKEEEARQ